MASGSIFVFGVGMTVLVVVGLAMTVIEFRKLEKNPPPRNPNFPL
jgi:hypothetical protein